MYPLYQQYFQSKCNSLIYICKFLCFSSKFLAKYLSKTYNNFICIRRSEAAPFPVDSQEGLFTCVTLSFPAGQTAAARKELP